MAKFTAEELSSRINELEIDDDVKISLMEDITDSVSPAESEELSSLASELEKAKLDYEELKTKYKERFITAIESEEKEDKIDGEYEEKKIIDVKKI